MQTRDLRVLAVHTEAERAGGLDLDRVCNEQVVLVPPVSEKVDAIVPFGGGDFDAGLDQGRLD